MYFSSISRMENPSETQTCNQLASSLVSAPSSNMSSNPRTKLDFDFFFFMYDIQHCFICRPSDSTVSGDAGIEPRTAVTKALAVRRSNHSTRSHPDKTGGAY